MTTTIVSILLVGYALIGPILSQVEEPNFSVLSQHKNNIEVRAYEPMIVAEVEVKGKRDDAIGDGFRILADYIFGENIQNEDIAMTAPVEQKSSEKISMTAPVQQTKSEDDSWLISFVMPKKYTLETLPKPKNSQIHFKKVPAKYFAVVRFSGTASQKNIDKNTQKLEAFIAEKGLQNTSLPKYAFYNPPITLPFLRRNEVMVEIQKPTLSD